MNFINKINTLKASYDNSECGVRDCAILLGKFKNPPPLAEHMIFFPMSDKLIKHLLDSYKLDFPDELLQLYNYMNGANLFWSTRLVGKNKIHIPIKYLSVFGVPLTHDRTHIEPYNISIEDLNRPNHTPSSWLKFGCYSLPECDSKRWDLFVDTYTGIVYSVENGANECIVSKTWTTIDECLCGVFDDLICQIVRPD